MKKSGSIKKISLFFVGLLLALLLCPFNLYAAVEKVIAVPWQGDVSKYHTAWNGQQVYLKGVVHTNSTATIYYRWNFGDGTESAILSAAGATKYNVEATHTYTGSVGTPFTAKLMVADNNALAGAVEDPYLVKIEEANLDSKINLAIDNGLWYLYKSGSDGSSYYHTFDGSPLLVWSYGGYYASPTASAIHAMQINGHKETGDPDQDPYVTAVERGLNWLFNGYYGYYWNTTYQMLRAYNIEITPAGHNPDSNGNGIGIEVRDYGYRPVYESGMVVDAIIASGTPNADSGRDFDGDGTNDTYREVLNEMLDMYAWGQYDGNTSYGVLGGWRYNWNEWPDNSACQWAAIGMIPAQQPPWNLTVPAWVKEYNDNWLDYSFWSGFAGHPEWGGFGYTSPSWGHARTPSGMVQLAFAGADTDDPRWVKTEKWFEDNWSTGTSYRWLDQNNVYAYYAFAKAMRLAIPNPVVTFRNSNFDWYRGDGSTMGLAEKIANQLVASSYWDYYGRILGTSWSVIILRPVLFQEAPIACFDADPNPSYPDAAISFDPNCSDHSEPGKDLSSLTEFAWDWDNDGSYDQFTSTPDEVSHPFACPSIPCTYPVNLRVTDDSTPARSATYVSNIQITNPPHPPVADNDGPYMVSYCQGDELTLDGSGSFDPDEGQFEAGCTTCPGDTVTAWDWDLNGAPFTYTDASGEVLGLGSGFSSWFPNAGSHDVGLRVTDNTAAAYPGSTSPDLTDADFTQVNTYEGCLCELTFVTGCGWVNLSWADNGADEYRVYRSFEGPDAGFEDLATAPAGSNNRTLGSFVMDKMTWYRVMAISGGNRCLSSAVAVYAEPEQCNPSADANGPYEACVADTITLDGSGSTAQTGTIVTWEWDLDNDGSYDDAFGETVQHSWSSVGDYTVGLEVVSSDSLVLSDTTTAAVNILDCPTPQGCAAELTARPKLNKMQLVWIPSGADHYNVYRSTTAGGPYGFIGSTTSDYATYLDTGLTTGVTYYYVVRDAASNGDELCQSNEAFATLSARRTR